MSVKRYDFDCYAFYDSARLTANECEDGDYVLHSETAWIWVTSLFRTRAIRRETSLTEFAEPENGRTNLTAGEEVLYDQNRSHNAGL